MAPANRPYSTLRVSISPDADSFHVTEICTPAFATMAADDSLLKSTINATDSDSGKCRDSLVDNAEEEEECQTPKSEEHKIPPVICCPPAPRKPKWIRVKRKVAASPLQGFYIPSNSDLQSLFGSDLVNVIQQHMKKKLRTGETSLPNMSEKEGKGISYEEYNIETNSLYGEVH